MQFVFAFAKLAGSSFNGSLNAVWREERAIDATRRGQSVLTADRSTRIPESDDSTFGRCEP